MAKATDLIAVFDSGIGGISVLRELVKQMPGEKYLYYGDSANAPYGSKSTQQVQALTMAAAERLVQRGIKALVIACNTATSAAITELRQTYPNLIVVGIEPALKPAADKFPQGHIGIMATQVTLREEKLHRQLARFENMQVALIPAPGLVELIENGKADAPETEALLRTILTPYAGQLDALVLGCTHYPFVRDTIRKILPDTLLLDGSEGTARHTRHLLEDAGLLENGEGAVQMENSSQDPQLLTLAMSLI